MDNPAELDQLKTQVAQLKQQLDELRKFIYVEELESGHKILHVNCSTVSLQNPGNPSQGQGMLCATEDGPYLSLWGGDAKARVIISVKKEEGAVDLYQPELKLGVHLGLDDDNRPCVGIFDQGKPRAALKCTDQAGIVTVVHDDGLVRAMMSAEADRGQVSVINPDMKTAVKISSQGVHGGGLLTVHHPNGKAALILSNLPETGCIVLNDQDGKVVGTLPDTKGG